MDKEELSIGLLRDKLQEFGDVDYALDHEITEEYTKEPEVEIAKLEEKISRKEEKITADQRAYAIYERFRFLNFLYYLAPFALIFGVISLLLFSKGILLLVLFLLGAAKYILGWSLALRISRKRKKIIELSEKKSAFTKEREDRLDAREALLARAGILAAEIRYLEYSLQKKD